MYRAKRNFRAYYDGKQMVSFSDGGVYNIPAENVNQEWISKGWIEEIEEAETPTKRKRK